MSQRSSQKRLRSRRSSSSRRSSLFKQHVSKTKNELKKLQELKLKITWPRYIKDSRLIPKSNKKISWNNKLKLPYISSTNMPTFTEIYNRETYVNQIHKQNVYVVNGKYYVKYDTMEYPLTKFGTQKKLTELLNHIWETKLKSKKIHSYLGIAHHRPRKLKTKKNSKNRTITNHNVNSMLNNSVFVYPAINKISDLTIKSLNINKPMKFQSKIPKLNITIELTKK